MIQLIKKKYPAIGQTYRGFNAANLYGGGAISRTPRTFDEFDIVPQPAGGFQPFLPDDFPIDTGRTPLVGAPPSPIPPIAPPPRPMPISGVNPLWSDPNYNWNTGQIDFNPLSFTPDDGAIRRPPGVPPAPMPNFIANRFAQTTGIGTFSKFNMAEDVLQQQTEIVTGGVWSSGDASLTTFWSSSAQTTSQRRYYVEVYDDNPSTEGSAAQFSIAYGHAFGSGSSAQGQLNDSPSRAIYSQYRNLLLAPGTSRFSTYGSGSTNSIYAISFNRNRLKERLDPGNFEIPIANVSSRDTNATGSVSIGTTVHKLIDDSSINTGSFTATGGRVYNIVSGSIAAGVHNPSAPIYYGVSYPDYGVVVLDGNVLDQKLGFVTGQASNIEANNHFALFKSVSGSAAGFLARNSEKITSTHYFVRIKNGQFNYSNNPTFITGSNGDVLSSFLTDPVTYITTIGLYNDQQELLAIAKVSQPILKSFSRESLIRVKLDF